MRFLCQYLQFIIWYVREVAQTYETGNDIKRPHERIDCISGFPYKSS